MPVAIRITAQAAGLLFLWRFSCERLYGQNNPFFMKHTTSLKKTRDFQNVYQNGVSKADRHLVMIVLPNGSKENRLGISVSKKVGNSVVRHRITRLIRESYRLNEDGYAKGYDIVVIARPAAKAILFAQIEASMIHLARWNRIYTRLNP